MLRFLHRLKRLWDWLPVIWNDRDFDQAFLYRIIAFKLRRMQSLFEDDPYADVGVRNIQICANLMERLSNENIEDWGREKQHLVMFSRIFARKSLGWWS
jgi:hypothetical protein